MDHYDQTKQYCTGRTCPDHTATKPRNFFLSGFYEHLFIIAAYRSNYGLLIYNVIQTYETVQYSNDHWNWKHNKLC